MSNPKPVHKWKKGESGNPKGRPPKGLTLTEIAKELGNVETKMTDFNDPNYKKIVVTRKWKILEKVYQMAESGDISAIKLLWSYMEGMPRQGVDVRFATYSDWVKSRQEGEDEES